MFAGDRKTFRGPRLIFFQTGCDVQQLLAIYGDSVIGDVIFGGVGEAVVIDDAYQPVGVPDKLQGLIDMLHLVVMRMRPSVRCYKSVDTESSVVGPVAEVATIEEGIAASDGWEKLRFV